MANETDPAGTADARSSVPCGMAAIVGRTNTGKSTLLNQILQEKVSIVSPVVQTTRNVIRGILTDARGQLVFLDTPGLHRAESDLGRVMNKLARASIEGVDVVVAMFEAGVPPRMEDTGWITRLLQQEAPTLAVLNKADESVEHAQAYREAWDRLAKAKGIAREAEWHTVSALTGQGVPELVDRLFALMPRGPLLFPEDILTDFPRKLAIADVIREKLFRHLRQEIPHQVAVWVENIREDDQGLEVFADVYVGKPSQKGIVIGHKGRILRSVRRASTAELQALYEKPVKVDIRVRVEKNWYRNFWFLKKLGYVP